MWTVTLLLKPAIVTLHLLGGMLTLSLLAWLALREMTWRPLPHAVAASRWGPWAALALAVAFCQIAVAHNAGAAFMLIALLMLNFRLSHRQVSLA